MRKPTVDHVLYRVYNFSCVSFRFSFHLDMLYAVEVIVIEPIIKLINVESL